MLEILTFDSLDSENKKSACESVKNIFFLSSSIKSFTDEIKKEAFFKRWCGDYLENYSQSFFLLFETTEGARKLMGYLSACDNSLESLKVLNVPGLLVFKDYFELYPAHLHINFHPDARGKGWGSLLVKHYLEILREKSIKGVHLITSLDAPNVSFYHRLGFNKTETRLFNQSELYFMGQALE